MKLKLINSYKKRVAVLDSNGLPIKDSLGRPVFELNTLFRYGITGATAEELNKYRRFRNQDGTDYYREDSGVPLYHSNTFLGNEANIRSYEREDGRVGFSVDDTQVDSLNALAKQLNNPELSATIATQIMNIRLNGSLLELKSEGDDPDAVNNSDESLDGKTTPVEEEEDEN